MSVFGRFHPLLQTAIVNRLGWTALRPVQDLAGAAILDGHNAVILAPTAGGKTEAALFPALSSLVADPVTGVGVLYLAPIKALLNNQALRLKRYTEMVGLRRTVWHGDATAGQRRAFLREPTELLMTTPESLEVMLVSSKVDTAALFANLRMVVVDEVHALAGTDRGAHLMAVLERLAALSQRDVQRVGLSATVGNPTDIVAWLGGSSRRPGAVIDPPHTGSRRQLLVVHRTEDQQIARDAAQLARAGKSLVFCQSRATTEALAAAIDRAGTPVYVHHSAVSRADRLAAEERFHAGDTACIVCTSTLELGIDIGDLDRVLQHDAPSTVSSFLQRMGRTGRRSGQAANTTFLTTSTDAVLQAVALVQLARRGWVESVPTQNRCWPVLVHQLLAQALGTQGLDPGAAWTVLSQVPDLSGIHEDEVHALVDHMVSQGVLDEIGGLLVLGPVAERVFGRRNYMDLYAVFSSPTSYRVEDRNRRPVGSLGQEFVDRLVEQVSLFLLSGRAWRVLRIEHQQRRVTVERATQGRQPRWGGYLPQFLSADISAEIRAVVTGTAPVPFAHASAQRVLSDAREHFAGVLEGPYTGLEVLDGAVRWWTFAGGRTNATLRYALQAVGRGEAITADNLFLKFSGDALDPREIWETTRRVLEPEVWANEEHWDTVQRSLPEYRLSKFQSFLPLHLQRELVEGYLLDRPGAAAWCASQTDAGPPA